MIIKSVQSLRYTHWFNGSDVLPDSYSGSTVSLAEPDSKRLVKWAPNDHPKSYLREK